MLVGLRVADVLIHSAGTRNELAFWRRVLLRSLGISMGIRYKISADPSHLERVQGAWSCRWEKINGASSRFFQLIKGSFLLHPQTNWTNKQNARPICRQANLYREKKKYQTNLFNAKKAKGWLAAQFIEREKE